jgi:GTP pyrophosphokinase
MGAGDAQAFRCDHQARGVEPAGVLAKLAAQIAEAESNIDNVAIGPAQGDPYATITFTLQVLNRLHLAHIMRTLRRTPEVIRIARVKN